MKPISLLSLATLLDGVSDHNDPSPGSSPLVISNISTHSSLIYSQTAFFALPGATNDGHEYIAEAAHNGATCAVTEKPIEKGSTLPKGFPIIQVSDVHAALHTLATWWREELADTTKIIAVAGSKGKTTTKECLRELLQSTYSVYVAPGSYNSQIGVPLAMLRCPADAEYAIIEIAGTEPEDIQKLNKVVQPDHVVITNIDSQDHSSYLSQKELTADIAELLSSDKTTVCLVGLADLEIQKQLQSNFKGTLHLLGNSSELPTFGEELYTTSTIQAAITFPNRPKEEPFLLSVQSLSENVFRNVQLAISAAYLLGVSADSIKKIAHWYEPAHLTREIWNSPTSVTILRTAASSDFLTLQADLTYASQLTENGDITLVLAEPQVPWGEETIQALAASTIKSSVKTIYGFTNPSHLKLQKALSTSSSVVVSLVSSLEELTTVLLQKKSAEDVCVLQAKGSQQLTDLGETLIEALSPTRLYVDLSAMNKNLLAFRRMLGSEVKIVAMVKAMAYGTEAKTISKVLGESSADMLGVSTANEGASLRRAGVTAPILAMLGTVEELPKMQRYRITPVIYSPAMFLAAHEESAKHDSFGIHLEIDTGMHRSGLTPDEAKEALKKIKDSPSLKLLGLMNHFACADEVHRDEYTKMQLQRFLDIAEYAKKLGFSPILHAANTAASIRFPEARLDMIRIGLGLHGLHPSSASKELLHLHPTARLMSKILQIVSVPPGEGVGYSGSYVAPLEGGLVGVVPAGYFDGLPRSLANRGYVVVAGKKCPIVGNISMDSMTIDLSQCPEAEVGSDVLLFGHLDKHAVPFDDAAQRINTISYELQSRIGPRTQRIFSQH